MKEINWKSYYLSIIVLSYFSADIINKYVTYYDHYELKNIPFLIKIPINILLVLFIILNFKKQLLPLLIVFIGLIINYIIGHLFIKNIEVDFLNRLILNFKTLVWYLTIFIFIGVYQCSSKKMIDLNLQRFFTIIDYFLLIQFISVLIGIVTKIYFFQSYGNNRFGYLGLFINGMQANYIYIILILIFNFKIKYNNLQRDKVFLYLLIIFSSLLGTKSILLFNFLFINYYLYNYFSIKDNLKYYFGYFLASFFILIGGVYMIISTSNLSTIYNEKGILNTLTSLRFSLFTDSFIPFVKNNWTIFNYLFGGGMFYINRTEFELIDFFWFFGILGMGLYLYIINKYLLPIKFFIIKVPIFLLTTIFLLTGSFFSSTTSVLLFCILIIFLIEHKLLS